MHSTCFGETQKGGEMKKVTRFGTLAATGLLCGLLLGACGGGGSGGDDNSDGSSGSSSSAASSEASSSSSSAVTAYTCPATSDTLYFCDDFEAGTTDNWDLTPYGVDGTSGDATFDVVETEDFEGATTHALKYTAGSSSGNKVVALMKEATWTAIGSPKDYYVEARIMPLTNSTTGNKQLYMVSRYQDSSNFYIGGLNVQNSTSTTKVELGYMKSASLSRSKQVLYAISNDTSWYKVRFVVSGSDMTIYVDGEEIGTLSDSAFASGRIGLFTNNKSFYIDDIKVGDPADLPVLFTLSPSSTTYTADAGDDPYEVTVNASKADGSADTFTVVSDNTSVVTVTKGETTDTSTIVSLDPVGVGTANITFTSGSDPTLVKTIVATVSEGYTDSTATYGLTSANVYPAPDATSAYADDKLTLTFDSTPTLGTSGSIRIFDASTDEQVDRINLSGESDSIGLSTRARGVYTNPITIDGSTVTITPHQGVLEAGHQYYIGISSTAFTGAKINGVTFAGIGKAAGWAFTTTSTYGASTSDTTITVGPAGDSTVEYHAVQSALNFIMENNLSNVTVSVKPGTYTELLYLYNTSGITIRGSADASTLTSTSTVIQYNNYETLNSGSGSASSGATSGGGRSVFFSDSNDLLTLEYLTLKNTHTRSSLYSNQAETLYFKTGSSLSRLIAKHADFYSEQDTLQLQGYAWFYDTKVSGNVDFIWGNNYISLFENSIIEMLGDSNYPATVSGYENGTGGYILQARTYSGYTGFVFLNDNLTYADGPAGVAVATGSNAATYLARAASGTWVDNIAYINCKMDTHITEQGWADGVSSNPSPNPSTATATEGWREYNSMDMSGATLTHTSSAYHELTSTELSSAGLETRSGIFTTIGWSPTDSDTAVHTLK